MDDIRGSARCPIARSLDVIGDRWTLLIVRDALAGRARFSEFRESLGIPRDVLTSRLETLVSGGVLESRSYRAQGSRSRDEYVLTDAGRDLIVVLGALGGWGTRHRPHDEKPLVSFTDGSGTLVEPRFVGAAGPLSTSEVFATRSQVE